MYSFVFFLISPELQLHRTSAYKKINHPHLGPQNRGTSSTGCAKKLPHYSANLCTFQLKQTYYPRHRPLCLSNPLHILTKTAQRYHETNSIFVRALNDAEKLYDTTRKEYLAIVRSVLLLCLYFEGNRFTLPTGHDSNKWIYILSHSASHLAR